MLIPCYIWAVACVCLFLLNPVQICTHKNRFFSPLIFRSCWHLAPEQRMREYWTQENRSDFTFDQYCPCIHFLWVVLILKCALLQLLVDESVAVTPFYLLLGKQQQQEEEEERQNSVEHQASDRAQPPQPSVAIKEVSGSDYVRWCEKEMYVLIHLFFIER